jgi:hypothetical protein
MAPERDGRGKSTGALRLEVLPQPDDVTCGPTCLHAVYRFYGESVPLPTVISEVHPWEAGGTLGVLLGCHALARGYAATLYTYNLNVFDPTWFRDEVDLIAKLRAQVAAKNDAKLTVASRAYIEFLELGGELRFRELRPSLLRHYLDRGIPVLTGLSATYLYACSRETSDNKYNDIAGDPVGHFVVLCGYEKRGRKVVVADPLQNNPRFGSHYYKVTLDRLIGAILLGIVTYDANLLVIRQPRKK